MSLDVGHHHPLVRVWYVQPTIVMSLQHLLISGVHLHISWVKGLELIVWREGVISIWSTEHCGCHTHNTE